MYIYKITNAVNGKVYIGQTVQRYQKRFTDHLHEAFGNGDGRDNRLYRAMRKYGRENFSIYLLEEIIPPSSINDLNNAEVKWINHYNSVEDGYNLMPGGDNKRCHAETKIKISNSLKGRAIANRWEKGRVGPHSEETKQKLSEALKGRPIENRWTGGNRTPRTEEQKAHLSALIKGRPNTVLYKRVECIETGTIYESVNATAAAFGVNRVTISSLLKSGKKGGKLAIKGFSFRFI